MNALNKSNTSSQCSSEDEYAEKYPIISSELVTKHCGSAAEFLQQLLQRNQRFDDPPLRDWILHRGQKISHWTILPSALRQDFLCNDMVDSDQFGPFDSIESERKSYYEAHEYYEGRVIGDFVDDCLNEGIGFPSQGTRDNIALLSARAYALPTRLIDFTLNPVVAAFFAAFEVDETPNANANENAVVWSIYRGSFDAASGQPVFGPMQVLRGWREASTSFAYGHSEHMRRQRAVVVQDVLARDKFMATGQFQSLEDVLEPYLASVSSEDLTSVGIPSFARFTLPHIECPNLLNMLLNFNVSASSLFPTTDRIAEFTRLHFRRLNLNRQKSMLKRRAQSRN